MVPFPPLHHPRRSVDPSSLRRPHRTPPPTPWPGLAAAGLAALAVSLPTASLADDGAGKLVTDTNLFVNPKVFNFGGYPVGGTFRQPQTVCGGSYACPNAPGETIVFTSTNTGSGGAFIGNQPLTAYKLGANGSWQVNTTWRDLSYAALNGPAPYAMEFRFDSGPVASVGAFMNYNPDVGYGDALIEAVGAAGTVLSDFNLRTQAPISTPGLENAGAFRGIVRQTADIAAFRISGSFAILTDITFSREVAQVPGPLPALGAAAAFGWSRRLRRRIAATAPASPRR